MTVAMNTDAFGFKFEVGACAAAAMSPAASHMTSRPQFQFRDRAPADWVSLSKRVYADIVEYFRSGDRPCNFVWRVLANDVRCFDVTDGSNDIALVVAFLHLNNVPKVAIGSNAQVAEWCTGDGELYDPDWTPTYVVVSKPSAALGRA